MIWALGNIAGDGPDHRDFVLENGVVEPLLDVIHGLTREVHPSQRGGDHGGEEAQNHKKSAWELSCLRNATWTMSNLFRGVPHPARPPLKPALPVLASLLHHGDEEVLTDASWALSYASDGPNEHIQQVLETSALPRLVELLTHKV